MQGWTSQAVQIYQLIPAKEGKHDVMASINCGVTGIDQKA